MAVRLFSLLLLVVLSGTSAFASTLKKGESKFIAAVLQTDETIEVWINPRQHWIEEGALTDYYTPEEHEAVEAITDKVNLCNLAESQYEPCYQERSVEDLKLDLEKAGVEVDPEFQAWAETQI